MLKRTMLSAFIAAGLLATAQEMPKNDAGKYEYAEMIEIPGATKEQLFRTARSWFQKKYSKDVIGEQAIYTDDSLLGEMAANPNMFVEVHLMGSKVSAGAINYNIVLAAQEGKYKYNISGFYHESNRSTFGSGGALENDNPDCGEEEMSAEAWSVIKKECQDNIGKLIEDMKEVMSTATTNMD